MIKVVFYVLFILFVGMSSGNMAAVFKAMIIPLGIELGLVIFHSSSKWKQKLELTQPEWYCKLKHFNETKLTWYSKEEKERQQREKEEVALQYLIQKMKDRNKVQGD